MASDVDEYWARRRDIVPSPDRAVVTDGDRRLALLANVADGAVLDRVDRLATRLGSFPCLRTTPAEELHLTAKVFDRRVRDAADRDPDPDGGPDAAPDRDPDPDAGTPDVTPVERIDRLVRDAVDEVDPFGVRFPRLNLFPDTVYAEVADGGVLSRVNRRLCDRAETLTVDRDAEQFIPHLTLGTFTDDEEYDRLVDYLEANRDPSIPETTVTEFHLVEYDVTAEWPSATTTLRTYSL